MLRIAAPDNDCCNRGGKFERLTGSG